MAYSRDVTFAMLLLCAAVRLTRDARLKVFRINYSSGSLESADPAFAKDLYAMWTTHMIYNTLVDADEQMHIIPSLAKSWAVSNDALTYTFHLRTDVCFQDNATSL